MNQIFAVSCLMLVAACPPQDKNDYVNTYLIPEGYHGWLVVREKPGGKPRSKEVTYQFDQKGFCVSDINLGTDLFYTHYFYVKTSGQRIEIPSGDYLKELQGNTVYAWAHGTEGSATSPEFEGERWGMYFVGTPSEYEMAKQNYLSFTSQFHLYKTVEGTKN